VIQVGKNRWNPAFWAGSPSIVRRVAIEELGGIPTESATEDLHTSLLLHQRDWRTAYHPGVVALGIAPDDYDGFILRRQRWAQGAMQVIRREWRGRGISCAQRLNYVASPGTYFDLDALAYGITLASWDRVLGTVINGQGITRSDIVREVAGIPDDEAIEVCIAMGYPDDDFAANSVKSHRIPNGGLVSYVGF
jgi:hypothetical protein